MRCSGHVPPGTDPMEDPEYAGETQLARERLGFPQRSCLIWLEGGKASLLRLFPRNPTQTKHKEIDEIIKCRGISQDISEIGNQKYKMLGLFIKLSIDL